MQLRELGGGGAHFNPSTQEAKAGGFLSSRSAWSTKPCLKKRKQNKTTTTKNLREKHFPGWTGTDIPMAQWKSWTFHLTEQFSPITLR